MTVKTGPENGSIRKVMPITPKLGQSHVRVREAAHLPLSRTLLAKSRAGRIPKTRRILTVSSLRSSLAPTRTSSPPRSRVGTAKKPNTSPFAQNAVLGTRLTPSGPTILPLPDPPKVVPLVTRAPKTRRAPITHEIRRERQIPRPPGSIAGIERINPPRLARSLPPTAPRTNAAPPRKMIVRGKPVTDLAPPPRVRVPRAKIDTPGTTASEATEKDLMAKHRKAPLLTAPAERPNPP